MNITNSMRNNNRNIWSRRLAFQAVYTWSINNCDISDLILIFKSDENYVKASEDHFNLIVNGVIKNISTVDDIISKVSKIEKKKINPIELSILRCFIFELNNTNIPKNILISESLKLASKFGAQDSYKMVNAFFEDFLESNYYENK